MNMRLLLYGIRLRKDQLDYLKTKDNAADWIRNAIDEKKKREKLQKDKPVAMVD